MANLCFKNFQYDEKKDTRGDVRDTLLIVAALITAVTFQAGVNPPGGVWQETVKNEYKEGKLIKEAHTAGRAIYASEKAAFYVFLISNTLAFSSAILVIISLTCRFPFQFEIWVATISMIGTYASAICAITPEESVDFRYILTAAAVPFLARLALEMDKYCGGNIRKSFGCLCKVREPINDVARDEN